MKITKLNEFTASVVKTHYNHFFEGLKIRLEDELCEEFDDTPLVSTLVILEEKSGLNRMQFTSQSADKVFELVLENIHILNKEIKNFKKDLT